MNHSFNEINSLTPSSATSVILPVYNGDDVSDFSEALNSILNQTYQDFEIILVNDGSIDKSGIICDEYVKIDSRIFSFHKINGGVSSARNYGIEKSNYKYIAFIDADDFWEKDFLSEIVFLINKIK